MGSVKGYKALPVIVAVFLSGAASAAEAWGDDYYFGGLAGVGGWRPADGSFSPEVFPGAAPNLWTTTQTTQAAPSFSLIFGASRPVTGAFSLGIEGEAGYFGSAATSTSQSTLQIPFFGFSVTDSRQQTTQWSVPAEAALRLRVAYKVTPSVSVYGSLGPALGYARVRTKTSDTSDSVGCNLYVRPAQCFNSSTVTSASGGGGVFDPGLSLNTGVEFAMAANVSLRCEYAMTVFRSLTGTDPSGYGVARATPLFQEIRLGLAKHF